MASPSTWFVCARRSFPEATATTQPKKDDKHDQRYRLLDSCLRERRFPVATVKKTSIGPALAGTRLLEPLHLSVEVLPGATMVAKF